MVNLSVQIGTLKLKNPVTVASGTFGYTKEHYDLKEVKKLAALIPKTITLKAHIGNPPPRIIETSAGMLNAIGIENPGVDKFLEKKLLEFLKIGVPLIVSISGNTDQEFIKIIEKLNKVKGAAAIELNLSCPNLKHKVLVAQDAKATYRVVQKCRKKWQGPLIAKLSPNVTDIAPIASAAKDAGADALSLVNTFMALAVDIETGRSKLGNFTGGLSGPAIKPIALYMVHAAYKKTKLPIIAMGGIMNAEDALEFIIAGASVVAVGTFNFINPKAPLEILEGIDRYMKRNKIKNMKQIIGSLKEYR